MTAEEYVRQEILAGRLTYAHIAKLTEYFQTARDVSPADGKPGPLTRAAIERLMPKLKQIALKRFLSLPMPILADGRIPIITSAFRPKERVDHNGIDLFYKWKKGDQPSFIGDKGCSGRNADGTPKWVVPYDICAIAPADGIIQIAGNSPTGWRVWVDHGNGLRSGGFHLLDIRVGSNQEVRRGRMLGLVGDNPRDNDGRHLHFELSPVDRYDPMDPAPYFLQQSDPRFVMATP